MSAVGNLWDRRPEWPLVTRRTLQRNSLDAFELGKRRRVVIKRADILAALAGLEKEHLILMTNVRTLKATMDERERNAFDLGIDAGAAGLVKLSAAMAADLEGAP